LSSKPDGLTLFAGWNRDEWHRRSRNLSQLSFATAMFEAIERAQRAG
jgi:hypothetical protein